MQEGKYVYSGDRTGIIQKLRKLADCNVVMLPGTYFSSGIGIALPKGSLHKKYFDKM